MTEQLICPRTVVSREHSYDEHDCGRRPGDEPACEIDRSEEISTYLVGDLYVVEHEGRGAMATRITRIDAAGIWGITMLYLPSMMDQVGHDAPFEECEEEP